MANHLAKPPNRGLIDSSSTSGNVSAELSTDATHCFRQIFDMCTFSTEGNTPAVHSINVPSGTFDGVTIINPSYTCSGTVVNGKINSAGLSTP